MHLPLFAPWTCVLPLLVPWTRISTMDPYKYHGPNRSLNHCHDAIQMVAIGIRIDEKGRLVNASKKFHDGHDGRIRMCNIMILSALLMSGGNWIDLDGAVVFETTTVLIIAK